MYCINIMLFLAITKPANVLLGSAFVALLTYFRFSRYIDHSVNVTGDTESYLYMPSQVVRRGKYS